MALLEADHVAEIRQAFDEHLEADVKLSLVGPNAENPPSRDYTKDIRELLSELVAISPKLSMEYVDAPSDEQRKSLGMSADEGGPITVISGAARGKVRFVGVPAGHEFPSLVKAIIDVSRGMSEALTAASRAMLQHIERPVHIRVFFTPT